MPRRARAILRAAALRRASLTPRSRLTIRALALRRASLTRRARAILRAAALRRASLTPRARLTIRALALAATAAGCGSHTMVVGRDRVLHLAVSEYRIAPASASAPAGRLTLVVRNYGRLNHDLAIIDDGRTLASTQPLPPGSQAALTISLARGSYELESTLDSDATLGATATLHVT